MLKNTIHFTLTLCIAVLLGSCGRGFRPLTEIEKARFQTTISKVAGVVGAVVETQRRSQAKKGNRNQSLALDSLFSFALPSTNMAASRDLVGKLGGCTISDPQKSMSSGLPASSEGTFTISGTNCPISVEAVVTKNMSGDTLEMKLVFTYEVLDEDFKKMADLYKGKIEGTYSISGAEKPDSTLELKGKHSGTLQFVSENEISIYSEIQNSYERKAGLVVKSTGKFRAGLKYSDFIAELGVEGTTDTKGKTFKYFVNEKEVTEKEFNNYLSPTDLKE
jgi:hypothetical protein